jgi:hypothetical protein
VHDTPKGSRSPPPTDHPWSRDPVERLPARFQPYCSSFASPSSNPNSAPRLQEYSQNYSRNPQHFLMNHGEVKLEQNGAARKRKKTIDLAISRLKNPPLVCHGQSQP